MLFICEAHCSSVSDVYKTVNNLFKREHIYTVNAFEYVAVSALPIKHSLYWLTFPNSLCATAFLALVTNHLRRISFPKNVMGDLSCATVSSILSDVVNVSV